MRRATLVSLVVGLAFAAFVFYSLVHFEPLQVSGAVLEHRGNAVVVKGSVVNAGSNSLPAGLKVELFDAAGRKLGVQSVELGKLAPGQRAGFASQPVNLPQAENF